MKLFASRFRTESRLKDLSVEEIKEIEFKLLKGVVSRSSTLLFVWSFIGTVYGFLSIDLFHKFIPTLTVWENFWPRLVFTGLPALLLALWYRQYQKQVRLKAYLSIVIMPSLLVAASLIHAWPMIFKGEHDAYLYFHATNIIAMSSALAVISAPPSLVIAQALGFAAIYFGPLLFFFKDLRPLFPQLIGSDVVMISIILYFGLNTIYRLRVILAAEELLRKRKAASFLGSNLTKAIYETDEMTLKDRTVFGLVMSVDLRGFTQFMKNFPEEMSKSFMKDFHSMVAEEIYKHAGYLHKTAGDGLLISFGVMDEEVDLSDIPGLESEKVEAIENKVKGSVESSIKAFASIAHNFEQLRAKHGVPAALVMGAGLSGGKIDVTIRGDEKTRQELDIGGMTIIKAVRLESFSKVLNKNVDEDSSFMILDPELISCIDKSMGIATWLIQGSENQIRDFPNIQSVLYRRWKHNRVRSSSSGQNAA